MARILRELRRTVPRARVTIKTRLTRPRHTAMQFNVWCYVTALFRCDLPIGCMRFNLRD